MGGVFIVCVKKYGVVRGGGGERQAGREGVRAWPPKRHEDGKENGEGFEAVCVFAFLARPHSLSLSRSTSHIGERLVRVRRDHDRDGDTIL